MPKNKHLYFFISDNYERELCKLESKYTFNQKERNKMLLSDVKTDPSQSAFIKQRIDILFASDDYTVLKDQIKTKRIAIDDYKVEYISANNDTTNYCQRLEKVKEIGYCITGTPEFKKPKTIYALCHYDSVWYFGVLVKNNYDWRKHNQKPFSYSNSIGVNIAKALVNIAAQANKANKLLDACCGVGTIMLEACFAQYKIEGSDINWKVCRQARENLSYFNYNATVYRSDINDITSRYDAAIIDLPYNLFSNADENTFKHIIESTANLADRLVIVSTTDISTIINNAGLEIKDGCKVGKSGKVKFSRNIWVCEKK